MTFLDVINAERAGRIGRVRIPGKLLGIEYSALQRRSRPRDRHENTLRATLTLSRKFHRIIRKAGRTGFIQSCEGLKYKFLWTPICRNEAPLGRACTLGRLLECERP